MPRNVAGGSSVRLTGSTAPRRGALSALSWESFLTAKGARVAALTALWYDLGMNPFAAQTVILANGLFPTHATPAGALRAAAQVVCCDGASDKLVRAGLQPSWIVGDLDSVSADVRARFGDRLVRVSEQDTNDLGKAFRFCLSRGWTDLLILGATGLREDHMLGNVSLLADFARQASVRMLTDTGWFTPLLGTAELPSQAGQQVSLFSLDPRTAVSADGLRYPLEGLRLERWWQASLNEACGDRIRVRFEGGPVLVFQTYAAAPAAVSVT